MKVQNTLRIGLLLLLLSMSIQSAFAQVRPAMNVYVNWTPKQQLSSIDLNNSGTVEAGDDFRYVDMQIFAQGNVSFWATKLSCTLSNATALELISLNFPEEWGISDDDYYYMPQNPADLFNAGTLAFTATRIGVSNPPLGISGQNFTQLIASARFRVLSPTSNLSVAASCRTMDFFDRDGNVSIRGRQTRLGDLSILVGYTLTGTALREGTSSHQNIRVTCYSSEGAVFRTAYTDSRGNFKFGGATNTADIVNSLRDYGIYRCLFTSEYIQGAANGQILQSVMYLKLNSPQHNLLPVTLRAGDHQDDDVMNFDDIVSLTTFYGNTVTPFSTGDANGNGLVDDTDLVITAGNIDTSTQVFIDADIGPSNVIGFLNDHVIYGLGRDLDPKAVFPNSRLWLGDSLSGAVSPLNARSRTRDFWPQLSPDGSQIAFVSEDSRSGMHNLAILNVVSGRVTGFRMPRDWTRHAFAPSWSPDGNQIAFACADGTPDNAVDVGYLYNRSDICVINANDTRGSAISQLGVNSLIYPPTWMTYDRDLTSNELEVGYLLLYGGTDGKIHYYDIAQGKQGIVPITAGATDELDQPHFVNFAYADSNWLAYRIDPYNDTNPADGINDFDPHIRIAEIGYDGTDFGGRVWDHDSNSATALLLDMSRGITVSVDDATHFSLATLPDATSTTGVDYYDVSPALDVIFYYEYNYALANIGGDPFLFYSAYQTGGDSPAWSAAQAHVPDSFIGNPVAVTNGNGVYSPLSNNPTELHAHRATFDWVP